MVADTATATPTRRVIGKAYVAELQEFYWLRLTSAERSAVQAEVASEAESANAEHAVIQAVPDSLFPMTDKTAPYIAWQQPVANPNLGTYTIFYDVTYKLNVPVSDNAVAEARAHISVLHKGSKWRIFDANGSLHSQGVA